jgi:diguanylate cyclase (GGDEF)-like protein
MMAGERGDLEHRHDDVGTLMHTFTKMLGTIDQQAAEINSFASRLDTAYKEMESTNARLNELVLKDEMTGLYNRRFFLLRLEEEISGFRRFKHPLSVLFLHLDGVEHLPLMEREDIQREFAAILSEHTHGINVVSRYDGNRFAVLLVATSEIAARVYLDRIHEVVGTYSFAHGEVVTMRAGAVSLSDDQALTADMDLLLAAADAVLRR